MKKKITLLLTTVLLLMSLAGCGEHTTYETDIDEPESTSKVMTENNTTDEEDNVNVDTTTNSNSNNDTVKDSRSDGLNIGREELISRYNNNIKNDPENANASYGDIAFCSFDSHEILSSSYSYNNGSATAYMYFSSYEDYIKDAMGSTIMVDNDTNDVIWAEIYAREELIDSASTGKIIQNMFWYLSTAVCPKMSKTEFNGIWYEIASGSNMQTEYNDFIFMVEVVDGAYHFVITKEGIVD